jgi:imidazolonepropionase-like amidohydrolase
VAATVIPGGLVDAHTHLTFDMEEIGLPAGQARVAINLAAAEAHGTLALRDAGSRDGIDAALLDPSRHQAAARFVAPAGGPRTDWYDPVAPEDLVAEVGAMARAGAPWIKLMADYPGDDGNWFAPRVLYDLALVAEAVAVAHDQGARVMAHVSGPIVGDLVRLGVDSIEHGPLIDALVLEEMAERGTLWCPTIGTIERHLRPLMDVAPAVPETFSRWPVSVPMAVQLGVPVLAGSDELGPRGLAREIDALVRIGGLSPAQALHAATDGARAALGLPAPRDAAVVFDGDPAQDIGALARVLEVRPGGALPPLRPS